MKKIIALGASGSKNSINNTLAVYVASKVENTTMSVIDLSEVKLPLYSVDAEEEFGIPEVAHQINEKIACADGLVISLAEHNGSYTAIFKNLIDWLSRIDIKVWKDLPMLLMSTSPGGQGGASVLATAKTGFPYMGGHVVADFSLPSFYDNFSNTGINNQALAAELDKQVKLFEEVVNV